MIKSSVSPLADKVFELSEQEGALKAYITELEEACEAGYRVERALSDAKLALDKARSRRTWDLLGGGLLSGMAKHQNIDKAESYLQQAQKSLREFQKELLDVKESAFPEINISGMLKFADFFFDGIISDYMVQGKINRSLDQTKDQYDRVTEILMRLEEQMGEKMAELEEIQEEKQGIVERV